MAIAPLPRARAVTRPGGSTPLLLIVVDTEEEFDWAAPFSRANTSVTAMRHVGRAHAIYTRYGIKPTYALDYPVASQEEGAAPLRRPSRRSRGRRPSATAPGLPPPARMPAAAGGPRGPVRLPLI